MSSTNETTADCPIKSAAHELRGAITTLQALTRHIGKEIPDPESTREIAARKCAAVSEVADRLDAISDSL